jgi:hypothetical protein
MNFEKYPDLISLQALTPGCIWREAPDGKNHSDYRRIPQDTAITCSDVTHEIYFGSVSPDSLVAIVNIRGLGTNNGYCICCTIDRQYHNHDVAPQGITFLVSGAIATMQHQTA